MIGPAGRAPRVAPAAAGASAESDATTDAFTVRAGDGRAPAERPALRAVSGDTRLSALSFGAARRPRPTPPFGQPRATPAPRATPPTGRRPALRAVPDPLFDPLPPGDLVPLPSASPLSGPLPLVDATSTPAHAAPTGAVPAPRARHRADVSDPVAARRGEPRHGRPADATRRDDRAGQ